MIAFASIARPLTAAEELNAFERQVLEELVQLYGREEAPRLYALAKVESNVNPDAIGDGGISLGAWQVNTDEWGSAAAPMGAAAGNTRLERVKSQARAMRPVVDDARRQAPAIASSSGGSLEDAWNLVWQFGARRARELVGLPAAVVRWHVDVIAEAIARFKGAAFAGMWRAREAAFRAAYEAAVRLLTGLLAPILWTGGAAAGAGVTLLVLLVLLLLYMRSSSRARA